MDPLDDQRQRRLLRNAWLSCVSHAFLMALFPIATLSLFLTRDLGLAVADVFFLQATFGFVVALLEVPSGYLADRIGYRITMLIGAVLGALGWVAYCFTGGFVSAMLAEVALAIGVSLISGTDSAMLYESLRGMKREHEFGTWFSRMRASGGAAEGSAALLGAFLYSQGARIPFVVQAAVWLANVLVVMAFVEPARERGPELRPLERCAMIVRFAATGAPRLRRLFALYLALTLPPYVMVWALPVYVEQAGNQALVVGPIWAASCYMTALFSWLAPKLELRYGALPVLGACAAAIAIGYGGMAASDAQWAWAFVFALCFTRGAQQPILHHEEQRLIPSSDRAALLSIKSLLFRGSFVIVGPIVGAMIDAQGMKLTLAVAGGAFALLAGLAWSAYGSTPRETAPSIA